MMRRHDSAQLLLIVSLGGINLWLSLGCLLVHELAPKLVTSVGVSLLLLSWSVWLLSARSWLRGRI